MEIDFSPLETSINNILMGLMKVLGIPFLGVLVVGFILVAIKVPKKVVVLIAVFLFLYGVFQMFKIMNFT